MLINVVHKKLALKEKRRYWSQLIDRKIFSLTK